MKREQVPDQESRARVLDFDLAHLARTDRRISQDHDAQA
jgi:hypothetical protein